MDELLDGHLAEVQQGTVPADVKRQVISLGEEFGLVTQYTSFVAVEELTVTVGGEAVPVMVPVEMPEGVSYDGVFGDGKRRESLRRSRGGVAGGARGRFAAPADRLEEMELDDGEPDAPADPNLKLQEALRDLAARVEKEGTDGNLTAGKIQVQDWKVAVLVYLSDMTEETLAALQALGFDISSESKAVSLLAGTLDVRKLAELAKLEAVIRVEPVTR